MTDALSVEQLHALSGVHGIDLAYTDALGQRQEVSPAALQALLQDAGAFEPKPSNPPALPPVLVVPEGATRFNLPLQGTAKRGALRWRVLEEEGVAHHGEATPTEAEGGRQLAVEVTLPWGYHRLSIEGLDGSTLIVCAPLRCHEPAVLARGGRLWGVAVQLYGLRSARNWGMGDFGDLKAFAATAARQGAAFVGLNPLHALFAHNPVHTSPYSPSSRAALNVIYIDVEALPDYADCKEAQALVGSIEFQARLQALRAAPLVDYPGVAAAKQEVLTLLHARFQQRDRDDTEAQAFARFQTEGGAALREHALFEALQAHFHGLDEAAWGWPAWPEAWRDPRSHPVQAFAREHPDAVNYHQYLQWQASRQLADAARTCSLAGMQLGLYLDLAVSVDRGGSDTWRHGACFALQASVGAPPDLLNRQGQDWGLPPLRPDRLRENGHAIFIEALRANMRCAGALRIDHVMMLMRLFWVPAGSTARDGAYVHYPWQELFAILALESRRHQCMVIGEDLGTVPEQMRGALREHGVLSYRLLYFERDGAGAFQPPQAYPREAVVAVSTHDLPTFAGWWSAADVHAMSDLGLRPDGTRVEDLLAQRATDRERLAEALGMTVPAPSPMGEAPSTQLETSVHAYLSRAPSALMAVQLEDLLGQVDQANLPGTTTQHPNWRRKYGVELQAIWNEKLAQDIVDALVQQRPPQSTARIPRATYRLQLHKHFDFDDAAAIVPYLARLGISHVYCSPIHRARPGSLHGYDVVAHDEINPELGGMPAYVRFSEALRSHGMGQLLDLVPNHMGVLGGDNAWWNDVLEKGQASPYAEYFDIDWHSATPGLAGKVLLPVLGDPYGDVLARGEITVGREARTARWFAHYFDHRFPLAPESVYTQLEEAASDPDSSVLERALEQLNSAEGHDALHALLDAQSWRLAHWRCAADEINYRRFFDVNELAALRTERQDVFDATHGLALELAARGWVDGLRIDHPDGLLDPAGYFDRLQAGFAARQNGGGKSTAPLYVVAEKITADGEDVPLSWAIHGTTGYRFANVANGVLVDGDAGVALMAIWHEFTGLHEPFESVVRDARHTVATTTLASDLETLAHALHRIAKADRRTRDHTLNTLRDAISSVAAAMPVYRTYNGEEASEQDERLVGQAVDAARECTAMPEPSVWDFMRESLLGRVVPGSAPDLVPAARRFARRFQQYSAPVAAKGVEDTAFYRYFPLSSLNEVGGDPQHIGMPVAQFHEASLDRQRRWPHTMLATSTHDNKRSEDVRLRINLLSECPQAWRAALQRWKLLNARLAEGVSPAHQYLFYQAALGTLPLPSSEVSGSRAAEKEFADRLAGYMLKAAREGKTQTSWTHPDTDYEAALERFVRGSLTTEGGTGFLSDLSALVRQLDPFSTLAGLSMQVLKLCSPGVPDIYQGCELIERSLVDPDNRRPVDYAARSRTLDALRQMATQSDLSSPMHSLLEQAQDGRAKLWSTWRLLELRQRQPDLFQFGSYEALEVQGALAPHVVAFMRRHDGRVAVVIVLRLFLAMASKLQGGEELPQPSWRGTVWADTRVLLPAEVANLSLVDVMTGQERDAYSELRLDQLITHFPGAVLVNEDAAPVARA